MVSCGGSVTIDVPERPIVGGTRQFQNPAEPLRRANPISELFLAAKQGTINAGEEFYLMVTQLLSAVRMMMRWFPQRYR
jgi:hypothetical protein